MAAALLMLTLIPFQTHLNGGATLLLGALAAGALFRQEVRLASVFASLAVHTGLCTLQINWPWPPLSAALAYGAAAAALGLPAPWWAWGRLSRRVLLGALGCILAATTTLVLWTLLAHPDLHAFRARLPEQVAWPALVALALLFSCVNAAGEELLFRGMLLDAAARAFGDVRVGALLQAVVFGAMHWHGFPNGWWGVGLATVYGGMMATLRLVSGGLLAPWLTHGLADAVIVVLIGST